MIQPAIVWNRNAAGWAGVAVLLTVLSLVFVDQYSQRLTAQFGFRGDVRAMLDFIASLGHGVFCAFVVITVLCLDRSNWRSAPLIVLAPLLSGLVTTLIKLSVRRPRPAIVAGLEPGQSVSAFDLEPFQSFPSGHTATAFALASALAMIYPHGKAYFFTLAALVGIQRVLVQAHYPSDVFSGALIGFLIASLTGYLLQTKLNPQASQTPN